MVEQHVALVTGSNKGIGYEIARQLAERGMMVWMGARDAARGQAAADVLGQDRLVRFISLDVTDELSVIAAVAMIEHEAGRLDVLVNNAGIAIDAGAPPSALDLDIMRRTYETNVFAPVRVTQAFLPLLRAAPAGRVVMVSSGLGSLTRASDPGSTYYGVNALGYCTSKTALNAITVAFAQLYAFITSERCTQLFDRIDTQAGDLLELQAKEVKWHKNNWEKQGEAYRAIQRAKADLENDIHRIIGAAAEEVVESEDSES